MGRNKIPEEEKLQAHSIALRRDQLEWMKKNRHFKINIFIREKIDEYIKQKEEIKNV